MAEPQIIRTPAGEEMVVLSRDEYESLRARADSAAEDEDDNLIYDTRKAALASGEALLPASVSAAILRGDSRLKAIRQWKDDTQLHLAHLTGLSQGYLADLESGRRTGTAGTLSKLAEALGVPASWLL